MASYSKKTKCQGCKALIPIGKRNHVSGYTCRLNLPIEFTFMEDGQAAQPAPTQKCWKPRTPEELKALVRKMPKREPNEA